MTEQDAQNMQSLQAAANQYLADTLMATQQTAGHMLALRDLGIALAVSLVVGLLVIWNLLASRRGV